MCINYCFYILSLHVLHSFLNVGTYYIETMKESQEHINRFPLTIPTISNYINPIFKANFKEINGIMTLAALFNNI